MATSCGPKPAAEAPPVETPARFSESGNVVLDDRWWTHFGDPVLDTLVGHALRQNFTLKTAWDRLDQAAAAARREGAALYPSLTATVGAGATSQRSDGPAADGTRMSLTTGLMASYEVDLWGRVRASRHAATYDLQASEEDLRTAGITVAAQVADTWYRLSGQTALIGLLEEQLRINEKTLGLVEVRFDMGAVGAEDVLRQRQAVESRRGELALARSRAEVSRNQLRLLLGRGPGRLPVTISSTSPDLPPMPSTGVPAELVRRRPDIRKAYFALLAADRRAAAAAAARLPSISITARANATGENPGDLAGNWLASLMGNMTAPILDGGRLKAESDRSVAIASASVNSYALAVLTAFAEVENLLSQGSRQEQYAASLARQVEIAGAVVDRARDKYVGGAGSYLSVLDATQTLHSLQKALLDARVARLAFRVSLCRALAGGWELTRPVVSQAQTAQAGR